MKKFIGPYILLSIFFGGFLTGCSQHGGVSREAAGAIGGAALGGLVGSRFGGGSGQVIATGVGAAVGAYAGGAWGRGEDKKLNQKQPSQQHGNYINCKQYKQGLACQERDGSWTVLSNQ